MEKTFVSKLDSLDGLPEGSYEGYYWASDAPKPEKIQTGDSLSALKALQGNPFVMEALLYDRAQQLSIHIQHTGHTQITCYDWKKFDESHLVAEPEDQVTFLPQKIEEIEGVQFLRVWKKEEDPLCEGYPVLKMYALVFTGFKTKTS